MFCQTLRIIHEPDSNQNFVDHIGSFDQIVSFYKPCIFILDWPLVCLTKWSLHSPVSSRKITTWIKIISKGGDIFFHFFQHRSYMLIKPLD